MWKSSLLLASTTKEMLLIYRSMRRTKPAASNPKGTLSKQPEIIQEEEPRVSTRHYALRPRRNHQPERLKDYELG